MQKIIALFFIFSFHNCYSQDSLSYKKAIDSILILRSKTKVKKIKVQSGNFQVRYFFEKSNKELALIEVIEPKDNNGIWIYNYHFVAGKLIMINKYNNHPVGDKMRKIAFYYFKDDKIVCRDENETLIENIETYLARAVKLKIDAPKY